MKSTESKAWKNAYAHQIMLLLACDDFREDCRRVEAPPEQGRKAKAYQAAWEALCRKWDLPVVQQGEKPDSEYLVHVLKEVNRFIGPQLRGSIQYWPVCLNCGELETVYLKEESLPERCPRCDGTMKVTYERFFVEIGEAGTRDALIENWEAIDAIRKKLIESEGRTHKEYPRPRILEQNICKYMAWAMDGVSYANIYRRKSHSASKSLVTSDDEYDSIRKAVQSVRVEVKRIQSLCDQGILPRTSRPLLGSFLPQK